MIEKLLQSLGVGRKGVYSLRMDSIDQETKLRILRDSVRAGLTDSKDQPVLMNPFPAFWMDIT